jgi:predicted transcriptional regulator
MVTRCETVGKQVLPVFRSLVAKELVKTYKLTQVDAAQKLGTTQAAISQYINSKRAFKGTEEFGDILPKLQAMARKTAKRLSKNEIGPEEVVADFCKICPSFCRGKELKGKDDYAI